VVGPSSWWEKGKRVLWWLTWASMFRLSPRPLFAWRRFLLRAFGARIARGANVHGSCKIWAPWNLEMGEFSCLAFSVDCYSVARVSIEPHATVSQYAYLCTASHDITDPHMKLVAAPISVGRGAWVAAGAFVGPGVTIGEGAVVGARAVVMRDVEDWAVVVGNPARVIKRRELRSRERALDRLG
jgi:putative colanic acid biosynthesis acetyltransferase WcaF